MVRFAQRPYRHDRGIRFCSEVHAAVLTSNGSRRSKKSRETPLDLNYLIRIGCNGAGGRPTAAECQNGVDKVERGTPPVKPSGHVRRYAREARSRILIH